MTVNFPGPDSYFDYAYISDPICWFTYDTHWDEFLDWGWIGRPYGVGGPTGDSVPVDTVITVWLSEPLNTFASYDVLVYLTGDYGNFVAGNLHYNESEYKLEFIPSSDLLPGMNYTIQVEWWDMQWNSGDFYWQFTTEPVIPEFSSLVGPALSIPMIAMVIWRRMKKSRSEPLS
jgi:hypothetical protein